MERRKSHPIIDGHKQCLDCNQIKPLIDYRKSVRSAGLITASCRICLAKKMRNIRRANGMSPRKWTVYPIIDGIKKCYKCLNDYPINQFGMRSGYLRHYCKECEFGTFEVRIDKSRVRYAKEKESRKERIKERKNDPIYVNNRKEWNKKSNHKAHSSGKYREWARKQSSEITDTYLMNIINRSIKGKGQYINKNMIEPETFEMLRTSIRLQREIKQSKSLN
jgi:hypothetical protein